MFGWKSIVDNYSDSCTIWHENEYTCNYSILIAFKIELQLQNSYSNKTQKKFVSFKKGIIYNTYVH